MIQSSTDAAAYVSRWFWPLGALADAAGLAPDGVLQLIEAGCAPGPIYACGETGAWWSALAASNGAATPRPPAGADLWYSPSAAWDLRRAVLSLREGCDPAAAAAENARHFSAGFLRALRQGEHGRDAFPACWTSAGLDEASAADTAAAEWQAWLQGAYGVCLRVFSPETCVAKAGLAARLKRRLADGPAAELLDDARALAALVLPFAPWERPSGTPGLTIDALLERARLGREMPYGP